jgi:hypothetical protein
MEVSEMSKLRRLALPTVVLAALLALTVASAATARSQAAPTASSNPTIEGPADDPFVGDTLTASNGKWNNNPTSYTYQWDRCDALGDRKDCQPIAGATSQSYKLQAADKDHTLRVRVTAKNADGSATNDSRGTAIVWDHSAPANKVRPTTSGTAKVGSTLTADVGTWAGATSYAYQWQQCDANGNNCTSIAGATGKTYGVRSADDGHTVRVQVTGSNSYGKTAAASDRSATVGAAAPPATTTTTAAACAGRGTQSASAVALPDRLLIDRWSFTPRTLTRFTRSFTARIHVATTAGCSVSAAQLSATAIPYNQTNNVTGTTDAGGWATLTFNMQSGFPANPGRQQILAMLVRATKPGGSVLAGVSTRRTLRQNVSLR